jgi:hypothetical protein
VKVERMEYIDMNKSSPISVSAVDRSMYVSLRIDKRGVCTKRAK